MPRTRRRKGSLAPGKKDATAASSGGAVGSTGEVLQKKAAAAASSGAAVGSTGEVLQKEAAAAASSGRAPIMGFGEGLSGSDSSWEMLQKKAAAAASSEGAPTMYPGEGPSGSDSSREMLQKKSVAVASSIGARMIDPVEGPAGSDSGREMLQTAAATSVWAPTMDPQKGLFGSDSAALVALQGNSTAQDREESDANHRTERSRTISSATIPHEHCTEDEGDMGSGETLQKQTPKEEADRGMRGDMLHKHLAEEADTAKGIKESDSNEIVHVKEDDTCVPKVKDLIKKMNASCIGEEISSDEFLDYLNRLPRNPPWIDLDNKLEDAALDKLEALHALYRFRYLKHQFPDQTSKEKLSDDKLKRLLDKSEDDCNQKFLEEEGFFRRFEEDMTLDWFIHPDYEECSSLTDYQRLVLQNYGGTEYSSWSDYHQYLHSYKAEEEYVKYYEELSEKLKWMDDYIDIYCPSSEWGYITTRAAYQAIKIAATRFHEITPTLAYNGLSEFEESIGYDATWFKGYDELYFEIWQRVTKKLISFKDAIEEVCKLKMFPLRQRMMETALEHDYTMEWMEEEYQTCTKGIALGDTDKKAQKLIAEAVPTLVNKPKFYAQYITKKIEVARIIGILPRENDSEE